MAGLLEGGSEGGGVRYPPLITVLPPPKSWDEDKTASYTESALNLLKLLGGVALVPEVHPEAGRGRRPVPFKEKTDVLEFALRLRSLGCDVVLSKYVSTVDREVFEEWTIEASRVVKGVVLVGKPFSGYPIPPNAHTVETAIPIAKRRFERVGGIVIPERRGELERVERRISLGMDFLVSQITFFPERVLDLEMGLRDRVPIYTSITGVFSERDVELLEWMGVEVPPNPPGLRSLMGRVCRFNLEHLRYTNLPLLYKALLG